MLTSLSTLPSTTAQDDEDNVQNSSLLFPSSLPQDILAETSPKLVRTERDLRLGQCQDALSQLHHHLNSRAQILKDKYINVCHQVPNTRSRNLLDCVLTKVNASANKYRAAYTSLHVLDPDANAEWRSELQPLHQSDLRLMSDADGSTVQSTAISNCNLLPGGIPPEGNRTISWIWRDTLNDPSSASDFHECTYAA